MSCMLQMIFSSMFSASTIVPVIHIKECRASYAHKKNSKLILELHLSGGTPQQL